ncbi:MAG: hypothetical protein IJZ72_05550 [Oscillospiraceae bacterium]|nr:hypothetical protein [Oscillospiraceae bacterium]
MSKSIKDYKKAMDNVRISDSFYERTERLLKESGSEKITVTGKKSGVKYIALGSMAAAAACAVFAFMHKPALSENDIAETVPVTSVSEVTPANETIYIDLEEDDVIYTISPAAIPETAEETAADVTAPAADDAPLTSAVTSVFIETVTEQPVTEKVHIVTEEIIEDAAPEDGLVQILYDIDLTDMETELTSYLNAGLSAEQPELPEDGGVYAAAAPSGINFLILDETSAAEVVEMTAKAVSSAPEAPVKNIRSPEFVIEINDFSTGRAEYMISVNDDGTITAARFEGEETFSKVYAVHREDFIRIEKVLFLKFGSISQYEDFKNE